MPQVRRVFRKKLKIIRVIVLLVSVFVVNNFFRQENPPDQTLHYEPVLKYIMRMLAGVRVAFAVNQNVAILINQAALPRIMLITFFRGWKVFRHPILAKKLSHNGTLRAKLSTYFRKTRAILTHLKHLFPMLRAGAFWVCPVLHIRRTPISMQNAIHCSVVYTKSLSDKPAISQLPIKSHRQLIPFTLLVPHVS